jgi:DNA-binding CsgD family transcriptional regulator
MSRPTQNRGKVLALPRAASHPDERQESSTELTLQGRRYRLVPIDQVEAPVASPLAIVDLLTARELQIIALVAEGRVNKQIADALRISEFTVSTHLRRIFTKLGVDTRAAMVSKCLRALAAHEP